MIKKLYLTVIIAVASIQISIPAFAWLDVLWLDTLIQRAWESLRPKDTIDKINRSMELGNIYTQSYTLAQKSFTNTTMQSINALVSEFNYKYSCNMEVADMGALLGSIDEIRNQIQASLSVVSSQTSFYEQSSFAWACTKMMSCMQRKPVKAGNIIDSVSTTKWTYLTDEAFKECKRYTAVAYNLQSSVLWNVINLANTNLWNDMYYNGTLDDSPYDLLVDIQRIGDVLFAWNEQTAKTLFYTFPNNSIAWMQAIPFDTNTTTTSLPDRISFSPNTINTSQWNNTTNTNPSGNINSTNNWQSQSQIATNQNSNQTNSTSTTTSTISTTYGDPLLQSSDNTIQNYACIPTTTTNTTNTNNWNNSSENNTTNTSSQSNTTTTTNTSNNTTNPNTWNTNWSIPPTVNPNTPFYSPIVTDADDPITANANWESPDEFKAQEASINNCLNQCKSLPAVDKALCQAKCMCGSASTKDGIFGLQVCTVPSKQSDVMWTKSVQSVEEIIGAINGVLEALRQSGEMTKHTKPKEFLDTSLSKISLNKIFAFDINIAFKPILDTKPRKMTEAEAQARTDQELAWNYSSIDIWREKNKYLALAAKNISNQSRSENRYDTSLTTLTTAISEAQANVPKLTTDLTSQLAKTQHAEVADIIKQFMDQNLRFRAYVNESLGNINRTAATLKDKIQQGK